MASHWAQAAPFMVTVGSRSTAPTARVGSQRAPAGHSRRTIAYANPACTRSKTTESALIAIIGSSGR